VAGAEVEVAGVLDLAVRPGVGVANWRTAEREPAPGWSSGSTDACEAAKTGPGEAEAAEGKASDGEFQRRVALAVETSTGVGHADPFCSVMVSGRP